MLLPMLIQAPTRPKKLPRGEMNPMPTLTKLPVAVVACLLSVSASSIILTNGAEAQTQENAPRLNKLVLSHATGTVMDEVPSAIADRNQNTFGDTGQGLRAGFSQAPDNPNNPWHSPVATQLTELPTAESLAITLPLNPGERTGGFAVWGQGFFRGTGGSQDRVEYDSTIAGAMLGVDSRLNDNLMAGIAFAATTPEADYIDRSNGTAVLGSHETELTSVHPYFGWRTESSNIWGSIGVVEGELTLTPKEGGKYMGDVEMLSYAVGFKSLLDARSEGGREAGLSIKGDAQMTNIEETASATSPTPGNGTVEAESAHLRLGLEVDMSQSLAEGGQYNQHLSVAYRYDSGDGREGGGLEVDAGAGVDLPSGLRFDITARSLLGHADDVDNDWGLAGSFAFTTYGGGRGLALALTPTWGNMATDSDAVSSIATPADVHYGFDVRYGIPVKGDGLLTQFVTGDAGEINTATYGTQYNLGGLAAGVESTDDGKAFIRYSRDF